MTKTANINTVPISQESTLVRVEMKPDESARQGGLKIGDVLDHMFNSGALQHVVVDIYDGDYFIGSYSRARIRIPGVSRKYLAARIKYMDELGVFTPTKGRIILDPNDEALFDGGGVHKGSLWQDNWHMDLYLRLPSVSVN
jgi:hypothetical protein